MSITDLLTEDRGRGSKIFGVVVGIVTNNKDPDGLGRVKVKIPVLSGDDESHWARVVTFMGGKERGAFFLPEVDDEVLVTFEHSDLSSPYVIGALWNGVDKPPETNGDGKNNVRLIKSRSGHMIRLDDTDGAEKIEVIDRTGKNLISVDTASNTVTVNSDKDITLSAPNGTITIEAQDVAIKASASAKTESGAGMELNASGTMTIKGATVNIN